MQSKIIEIDNVQVENFRERFRETQTSFLYRVLGYGERELGQMRPYFWQATRQETTESHGRIVFSFYDIETDALVFSVDARHYRNDRLTVRIAWEEQAKGMALQTQYWVFSMFGGPLPGLEELSVPGENLFMPLTPGVQIVKLSTTQRRLLEALRSIVGEMGESKLGVDELHYRVSWRGLEYLKQPGTWPNPLTIQAIIEDDKGNIDELVRVQIQQTEAEKVRLAVRGNPDLMKLAPIAWFVNFTVQKWLDGWKTELAGQEKEKLPIPEKLLKTLPGERGNEQWWTAYFNWETEYKKRYKWTNKQGYDLLGYSRSEYDRQKSSYKAEYGAL